MNRLDYRWGFDNEALMGVTRLVAPRPRKPLLAAFDQPAIDGKSLIPIPEGVDSFVLLSASPAKIIEALGQVGSGDLKGKIDDLVEKVKAQSRVDVDKDLLGNIGPKMALYLAPGRSAATTDEPPPGRRGGLRSDGHPLGAPVGLPQADPGRRAARCGGVRQGTRRGDDRGQQGAPGPGGRACGRGGRRRPRATRIRPAAVPASGPAPAGGARTRATGRRGDEPQGQPRPPSSA